MSRKFPRRVKRIVIKVGSSVIATYKMKPRAARLRSLVEQICAVQGNKVEVVLVSSGAIVLGMGEMNLRRRPKDLASLQMMAALGQTVLMRKYNDLFRKSRSKCAQVLLTWDDFDDRKRYNNARNALNAMMENGIVPVINENDTISTDEIKFGDNDKLSALVACLVEADLLILLSDVEGLYDLKDPERKLVQEIQEITQEVENLASGTIKKEVSKGGMIAKLEAIKIASRARIPCIIAHGELEDVLLRILKGERIGTFFVEKEEKLIARKHWISFGAKPKGVIQVDEGARQALLKGGRSLLLPGVIGWKGHFKADDVVVLQDQDGHEIARGIVNYANTDLNAIQERKGRLEVIHVDNLVLSER